MAPKPSVPAPSTTSASGTGNGLKINHTGRYNPKNLKSSLGVKNKSIHPQTRTNATKKKARNKLNASRGGGSGGTEGQNQLAIVQNNTNTDNDAEVNDDSLVTSGNSPMPTSSSGYGMGMGGMGMGGMGMGYGMGMGGMGMGGMGMGYGMGMGGMGMGPGAAIFTLNQYLFGFQSLIFSLGQAMNIVGMNTQALQSLYDQIMASLDQGLQLLQDLKTLEKQEICALSEEDQKRRRRLKALRWSLMFGVSYVGYSFVAKWLKRRKEYKRRKRISGSRRMNGNGNQMAYSSSGTGGSIMSRFDRTRPIHTDYGRTYGQQTYNQPNYGSTYSGGGYNNGYGAY